MNLKSTQEIVWIAFFSALLAVSAFIALPIGAVPFTLQVLVLFLTSLILGSKRASMAVAFYVFLGIVGFPFFSGGKSGLAAIFSPTGGFILAFIPTAFIAGFAQYKKWYLASFILLLSLCFLYFCGTIWLMFMLDISLEKAFTFATLPFIIPDLIKSFMAYGIFNMLSQQGKIPFQKRINPTEL